MKKLFLLVVGAVVSMTALFSSSAIAAAPDYSTLTGAVDFSTTTVAILTVAGALAVVYVTFKGAKLIMSAIRGG